jgi:hypothetical protein
MYDELLEKRKITDKELYEKVNSHTAQIETQDEFNKKVEKNLNNLSCEIKCIARATSMYAIDKENSIMDYVKQIKTVAPKLQIRKESTHKFSDFEIACEEQMRNDNPNWFTNNNI